MSPSAQRIMFAVLVALGGSLATLAQSGGVSPKIAMWILFVSGTINGILRVLPPLDPARPAIVPDPVKVPTLPPTLPLVALMLMVLTGCAWLKSNQPILSPAENALCVVAAVEAGLPAAEAAVLCKIGIDEVNAILAQQAAQKQKVGAALAARKDAGAP